MPYLRMSRVLAVLCFVELFFYSLSFTFSYTFLSDVFISLQVMWKMLERKPRYTFFFQKLEITLRKRLPWIICPTMTNISIKRSRLGKLCLATTHDQVESSFYLAKCSHIIKNEFAVFCHLTWYVTKFIVHKDCNYRYHLCSRSCITSVWYMA